MAIHAVVSKTSGAVPLLARDTAPSEPMQRTLPEPTAPIFRHQEGMAIEDAVTPPREGRSTDLTKASVPLPFMLTIIAAAIAAAAGVWRIESKVTVITTTIEYERQLDAAREKYLDQRFAALEAKIESAGLRNAALAMSQKLDEQRK